MAWPERIVTDTAEQNGLQAHPLSQSNQAFARQRDFADNQQPVLAPRAAQIVRFQVRLRKGRSHLATVLLAPHGIVPRSRSRAQIVVRMNGTEELVAAPQ